MESHRNRKHLSALIDDELSTEEKKDILSKLIVDAKLQKTWRSYCLIRAAIRARSEKSTSKIEDITEKTISVPHDWKENAKSSIIMSPAKK